MWVLTDCAPKIRRHFPGAWQDASTSALTPEQASLWSALSRAAPTVVETKTNSPLPWDGLVVVDHASESQFDVLAGLASSKRPLPKSFACVAFTGDGFHGLRNRPWKAQPGNLHFTASFSPNMSTAEAGHAFTILPALAACQLVERDAADTVRTGIKWVNDILCDGRKVAGVITETWCVGDRVQRVVVGVGINLKAAPDVPPSIFVPRVGAVGSDRDPIEGALTLSRLLAEGLRLLRLEGHRELMTEYRRRSLTIGERVRLYQEGVHRPAADALIAKGRVARLNDDLSLVLDGASEPIWRGRLAFERVCADFGI